MLRRGELYRVRVRGADPRRRRVYLIVSRDAFLDIGYSTAVAVPVYSKIAGSASEFRLGPAEGMKIDCVARCDELTSVLRTELTDYVGSVPAVRFPELSRALAAALAIEQIDLQR